MKGQDRVLRKAIKLGSSIGITVPRGWLEGDWCWVSRENGRIVIVPARVE